MSLFTQIRADCIHSVAVMGVQIRRYSQEIGADSRRCDGKHLGSYTKNAKTIDQVARGVDTFYAVRFLSSQSEQFKQRFYAYSQNAWKTAGAAD